MRCYLIYIFDKLWPAFFAVIVTQYVAQKLIEIRKPKLEMVPEGIQPDSWKHFNEAGIVFSESPYHTWRITVQYIKNPMVSIMVNKEQRISTSM